MPLGCSRVRLSSHFSSRRANWLGIWKIIHGWLDPVVAGKVHFTYGKADLEKFIAPENLIKELGGDEDWEYKYEEPVAGENDLMKDTETRDRILKERRAIADQYEAATREWVDNATDEVRAKRKDLAEQLRVNYWQLDPYVRARSLYDRQGNFQGGKAPTKWYPHQKTAPAAEEKVVDKVTEEKVPEKQPVDETSVEKTEAVPAAPTEVAAA